MFSKSVFRFLAVAIFAFMANIAIGQTFVDSETAIDRLDEGIVELEATIQANSGVVTYTGSMQQQVPTNQVDVITLTMMQVVREEITTLKSVEAAMTKINSRVQGLSGEQAVIFNEAFTRVTNLLS